MNPNSTFFPPLLLPFLYCFIFVFFFTELVISSAKYDYRFSNCSEMFNCGRNRYIYYPFWGGDRANYCGHPGYHLECRNDVTEIEIMSVKYQVLSFDQETQALWITRTDFIEGPCPSNNIDSTLDPNLFKYTSRDTLNLTLLYGCLPPLPIVTMGLQKYQFNCETSSGQNKAYYFRNPPPQEIMNLLMCRWRITVPIPESAAERLESGESTVNDVLRDGFEVEYLANISYCAKCGNSGGVCGYDWDLKRQTCFCYDSPRHQGWCPTKPPSSGSKNKIKIVIALTTIGASAAVTIAIVCYLTRKSISVKFMVFSKKQNKNVQKVEAFLMNYGSLSPRRYRYADIKNMTNSFKHKLGQGGYGSVFKGRLLDGRMIAVKLLSESKGNGEEFINEVASISRTSHINVVTLIGFCVEGNKRALIYEFMPNGSLEKFIYDQINLHPLGWKTLYEILCLNYL